MKKTEKKNEPVKKEEYIELTPRFKIGDSVLFYTDASIEVEKGVVIGVFTIPGEVEKKNYCYQVEHDYLDSKKKRKKGMCIPRSENINAKMVGNIPTEGFDEKFKKFSISKLDERIAENKENLKLLAEQMQKDIEFEKEVKKIITNLEKRKLELK